MCLIVKEGCNIEVANEDITCWKVVAPLVGGVRWEAIYQFTQHKFDGVLKACAHLRVNPYREIHKGFHVFIDKAHAGYASHLSGIVVECTIPKGAEYCLGKYNEIVANKMIVHKPNKMEE